MVHGQIMEYLVKIVILPIVSMDLELRKMVFAL